MYEAIKEILEFKENGKYRFKAKEVAEFHGVSLNAIYTSRRNGCKLDKLFIFDKILSMIEEDEKNVVSLFGEKNLLVGGLETILQEDKKYRVIIKNIEENKNEN